MALPEALLRGREGVSEQIQKWLGSDLKKVLGTPGDSILQNTAKEKTMTNQIIGPSEAGRLVAKIQNAMDRLNAAIRTAAVKGVNVTVETEGESFDHYWYKIIRIDDPRIDLEWEPAGTYAEEEAA